MNKLVFLVLFFIVFLLPVRAQVLEDEFVTGITAHKTSQELAYKNYDYESTKKIPILIRIKDKIKTEKDLYEGQTILFEVVKNVYYNNSCIISEGSLVKANVDVIISTGMNGIPASVIFSDFRINTIKTSKLINSMEVFGQDRSLFVFPLKWALTPLPPTGSLTNFIMGGHVKFSPRKILTIYYYPEWQ